MQLVYEDLLERAREKEEKEAKKRQRLAKDFADLLGTIKVWKCYIVVLNASSYTCL